MGKDIQELDELVCLEVPIWRQRGGKSVQHALGICFKASTGYLGLQKRNSHGKEEDLGCYVVSEFKGWDRGRSFRLVPILGQTSEDERARDVFVSDTGHHRCVCVAFLRGKGNFCKHCISCAALVREGVIGPLEIPA